MLKQPELDNVAELLPLSPTQGGILYECLAQKGGAYHAVLTFTISGPLDKDEFRHAFEAEVSAQDMCRACFVWEGVQQPVQVIRQKVDLPWEDFEGDPAAHLDDARRERFDLRDAPLMSVRLVRVKPDTHVLIWACHHIISDGWSSQIMLDRILARLEGNAPERPLPFSVHLKRIASRDAARDEAFWRKALEGVAGSSELPVIGATQQSGHRHIIRRLSPELSAACRSAAKEAKVTPATFLETAWALALSRLARTNDVIFGETHAGRFTDIAGTDQAVGPFVTTVPARYNLPPDDPLGEVLLRAERDLRERQNHCHIGLSGALKAANAQQKGLFDTLFVVQGVPLASQRGSLRISDFAGENQTSFPFALLVTPDETTQVEAAYDAKVLSSGTAEGILRLYQEILVGMCEHPYATIGNLIDPGPPAIVDGPDFNALSGAIHAVAQSRPNADAIVFASERITFAELDAKAMGLAAALRERGIGEGDIVPIATARSINSVIGMLGALYAGAAYTPLDLTYPEARLAIILEDVSPKLIITDGSTVVGTTPQIDIRKVVPTSGQPEAVEPDDLAYVIFTSGSTGRPKGVRITHCNLSWSTFSRGSIYGGSPRSFLHLSSFAFDSSIVGIYWTLASGGKLVIAPERAEQDPAALMNMALEEEISHLLCLPSLYAQLLSVAGSTISKLDTVIAAGEALTEDLVTLHRSNSPNSRLFNEYGPTEASVWCAAFDTADHESDRVPIGRAPAGAQIAVYDLFGRPMPPGIAGEIVVSGNGVSPGYLNRPEETALAFRQHGTTRQYKTGDRGVLRSDGNIVFLGRMDAQIKIRGHRIEPEEIAATLRTQEGREAAVVVAGDTPSLRLIAAVESARPVGQIRSELAQTLPHFMVPSDIFALDQLPRLPNGKVDRTAIANMQSDPVDPVGANSGYYLDKLSAIWAKVLKRPISPDTHFFDAGGDSLQSIGVLAQAEAAELDLRPSDLFDYPVLVDLAEMLADRAAGPLDLPSHYRMVATTHSEGSRPPFFMLHGSPEMYAGLAKALGPERPIAFAFSAYRGGLLSLGQSIEDMAAESVAALRAWRPTGPYAIGGYSIGGTIAIEMAHQLRNSGEHIEQLILLDPSPYTPPPESVTERLLPRMLRGLESVGRLGTSLVALARFRATNNEKHRFRYLNQAYRVSLYRYQPPVYDGRAHLLYSDETPGNSRGIELALPSRLTEKLHHKHLEFQKNPEAIAAWTGRIYELLNEPHGD